MTDYTISSERELISRLVKDYESKGYRVIVEPRHGDLPSFLRKFRPDLIATGADENVVVEVKRRSGDRDSDQLKAVAEAVQGHRGWRLDVVIGDALGTVPTGLRRATLPDIRRSLGAVDRLSAMVQHGPALLLLWSLLEAVVHRRLDEREVERPRFQDPISLAKDLVSFGFIPQERYSRFLNLAGVRNAIAHGYPNTPIDAADVREARKLIEKLIGRGAATRRAAPRSASK